MKVKLTTLALGMVIFTLMNEQRKTKRLLKMIVTDLYSKPEVLMKELER